MNLRPSGYEPDELPGCSTPRPPQAGRRPLGPRDPPQAGRRPLGPRDPPQAGRRPLGPRRDPGGDGGGSGGGRGTWRRPTLPRLEAQYHGRSGVSRPSSEWIGWGTRAMATRSADRPRRTRRGKSSAWAPGRPGGGARARSGARLSLAEGRSIGRLGPVSSTRRRAATSGLSTWWSATTLKRDLVWRWVSRLDAFSGYPVRTWLPGCAAGATTGPPEVRPPRSSRTRGSSSQVSNTHGR